MWDKPVSKGSKQHGYRRMIAIEYTSLAAVQGPQHPQTWVDAMS